LLSQPTIEFLLKDSGLLKTEYENQFQVCMLSENEFATISAECNFDVDKANKNTGSSKKMDGI
jgi:hypothetical protein